MIASHNTFSYLPPRHKIFNLFTGFWRCQENNINEQLSSGVEYLYVRVRYISDGMVRLCHGLVDYGNEYVTLDALVYYYIWRNLSTKNKEEDSLQAHS